jgi:protein-L-isoaspartate O-methyltransferase
LVEAVEQTIGHQLAPAVRDVFVRVDRRPFVPRYYVQQDRTFVEQDAGSEVYENRAFLTQLDARGVPNSSSSQPSLMAPMLEALDVCKGHRVLEIGTGTGYNAALLAELVGEQGQVVSVDIAAGLVEQADARQWSFRLSETGPL